MIGTPTSANGRGMRRLTIAGFIGVVIVYLIIVQGTGLLLKPSGLSYGVIPNGDAVWRMITLPVALSVLFGVAVVSYLRWWRPVVHDDKPVQNWVKIVPVLLIVSILATTGYSNLLDQSASLVLLLLIGTLLVGIGEELMFRGLGVLTFRGAGLSEGKVALWSSVVFGAVHMTNIFTEGPKAFLQAAIVSVTGYFLYLTRRASGVIFVPMVIHGLYDFSVFSHAIGLKEMETTAQTIVPLLMNVVLVIIVLVRRKHIEPVVAPAVSA